jgi:DNA-binding transcriptional ArsR family regulator
MTDSTNQTARRLKVLADGSRARIVGLLKRRPLCVHALACRLRITQGAVSQHLRVLRDAGLVTGERRGYYVHYRLNERALAKWREAIDRLLDPACGTASDKKGASRCPAATGRKKVAASRKT